METETNTCNLRVAFRAIATLLACGLATVVLGCGGDDSTSTESSTTDIPTGELTKQELASEADALCAATSERILDAAEVPAFGEDGPQPEEVRASAPFWAASVEEGQVLVDQLSQLQPSSEQSKQWEEFLTLFAAGTVDYADDLLGPAEDGDPEAFYSAALDAQRDLQGLAASSAALGMKTCGSSDISPS